GNQSTCSTTVTVLPKPQIIVTIRTTNTTCGKQNGTAVTLVQGGTAPYTYAWNNGATADSLGRLAAGSYAVTVTDANNLTSSAEVSIALSTAIPAPVIRQSGPTVLCSGQTAT